MDEQIKLQVRMNKNVYESLSQRANDLGFDSVAAYVRFWAKAESQQHGDTTYPHLSQPSMQALRYIELLLAIDGTEPTSLTDALDNILKKLKRTKQIKYLDSILQRRS